MTKAGTECKDEGYIKAFDLGEKGEIIPSAVGGSTTTYMCDCHYRSTGISLRTLLVGGSAAHGGSAGLGCFDSISGVGGAHTDVGFRTLNKVV